MRNSPFGHLHASPTQVPEPAEGWLRVNSPPTDGDINKFDRIVMISAE
ncbi:hypothetical protein [uncultured Cyclobacterium sp.]